MEAYEYNVQWTRVFDGIAQQAALKNNITAQQMG